MALASGSVVRVLGLISGEGHAPGLQICPWATARRVQEATNQCVSLTSMFLSLPLPPFYFL